MKLRMIPACPFYHDITIPVFYGTFSRRNKTDPDISRMMALLLPEFPSRHGRTTQFDNLHTQIPAYRLL